MFKIKPSTKFRMGVAIPFTTGGYSPAIILGASRVDTKK